MHKLMAAALLTVRAGTITVSINNINDIQSCFMNVQSRMHMVASWFVHIRMEISA